MSAFVFRYMQLICVAVLFDNMHCEQYSPANSSDHLQLLMTTGCTAHCIDVNQTMSIKQCYEQCEEMFKLDSNKSTTATNDQQSARNHLQPTLLPPNCMFVEQVCRDNQSMDLDVRFFEWALQSEVFRNSLDGKSTPIFLYQLQETDNLMGQHIIIISNESMVHVANLTHSTTYNVSVMLINGELEYSVPSNNGQLFRTQPPNMRPGDVKNIKFGKFVDRMMPDGQTTLSVNMSWEPSEDNTCHFNVLKLSNDNDGHFLPETSEIRKPSELHHYELNNLPYGGHYQISVFAIHNRRPDLRSRDHWVGLNVSTCLEHNNNNLSICAPPEPTNLQVHVILTSKHTYQLNATWDKPELEPIYYELVITDHLNSTYRFNVSGKLNQEQLKPLRLFGSTPDIRLYAYSPGGASSALKHINLNGVDMKGAATPDAVQRFFFASSVLVLLVFMAFAAVWAWNQQVRRKNDRDYAEVIKASHFATEQSYDYMETLYNFQKLVDTLCGHEMEVAKESIQFDRIIGQGAFGLVRRALLKPEGQTVAVKTLKEEPSIVELKAFFGEIEVMKSVSHHPNIVGIVGHYTKNVRQMMLLTEYCDEGNLLMFLKKIYKHIRQMDQPFKTSTPKQPLTGRSELISEDKPKQSESAFNFDTSSNGKSFCIGEKVKIHESKSENDNDDYGVPDGDQPPRYQALDELSPPSLKPRSLVVNRMYEQGPLTICSPGQSFAVICQNSCKSQIEIVPSPEHESMDGGDDSGFISDFHRRSTIRIRNCNCSMNDEKNNSPDDQNHVVTNGARKEHNPVMVDNPGYMMGLWNLTGKQCGPDTTQTAISLPQHLEAKPEPIAIGSQDLLSFADQISRGMDFLTLNKVVHRDLAARNVLVCSDKTVKIADFGLSRDVYENNNYNRKPGNGKLPIRWMAIESLLQQNYTSQSDVWSFGILLYEIVTLGRTPYPYIQENAELLKFLQADHRMERPDTCSNELFQLMLSCWESEPQKRPTFGKINDKLKEMIAVAKKTGDEHVRLKIGADTDFGKVTDESAAPTVLMIASSEQEEADMAYLTPICM